MKSKITNLTLKSFVNKHIKELTLDAKKSRKKYRILAIILSIMNIIMIGTAAAAVDLLITYHKDHPAGGDLGVILTSSAAAVIVLMFILQFVITIYRSKRKQDIYKDALDEIQLEVIKFDKKIGEYSKVSRETILETRTEEIKDHAINKKRNQKFSSLILKGLTGGEDA